MVRGRKEVVGLVAIESRGPETEIEQEGLLFIEEVLRGVESSLSPLGWPVLISIRRAADDAGAYQWLQKMSAKVDGLLIAEGIDPPERLARLNSRVPVVLFSGSPDESHADVVHADNRAGIRALVSHLIERHGRSRLCYVGGPPEAPDDKERRGAFEEELARHPGVRLTGSFEGRFVAASGQLAVREILAAPRGEAPDAIVCANDQMAIGAMRELQAAGIRVPADIAVTGFDDIALGALLTPPLTTVRQPMRLIGERACGLLLDRIADPALPFRVERLPTELIVRESCGCTTEALPRNADKSDGILRTSEYPKTFVDRIRDQGIARGEARGKAEAVLKLLAARHLAATTEQLRQVTSCTDAGQLDVWFDRAITAEVFAD
jgi:LacI family transcriptional regulator